MIGTTMVDMGGVTRIKCMPIGRLPSAAVAGTGAPESWIAALSNGDFALPSTAGGAVGDLRLVPDLDMVTQLDVASGWAWAPADQYTQEGAPHPACQRSFLRQMAERTRTAGLRTAMAFEFEWFTARQLDPITPLHEGPSFSANALARSHLLTDALVDALETQGMPIERFHPECSPGQFEVSLCPTDALRAADWHVLFRHTVRTLCEKLGLRASFSPVAWIAGLGNGCHLHLSLRDEAGANLFNGSGGPAGMSARGGAFTAGVLAELPAITAVACPTELSYQRLRPGRWVGAYGAWGHENRETALRLVQGMAGLRDATANLEVRVGDAGGNPYLVVGAVLAAGLDGIARGLTPPPPVQEDPSSLGDTGLARLGIRRLPQSLNEAAGALEASALLRAAMGDELHRTLVAVRRAEAAAAEGKPVDQLIAEQLWRF
jgi:glutamine synthetase